MTTAQTAQTQYITASNGIKFAYRLFGNTTDSNKPPLILHIHYRANMDLWDPLLLSTLSAHRQLLIFDQSGVGRSSGAVAATFQGWADNVIALATALEIKKFDLAGFSMGGAAVQTVAVTVPHMVRKLMLLGTTPSAPGDGSDVSGIVWPRDEPPREPIAALSVETKSAADSQTAIAKSFFYDNEDGRRAAEAYWSRVQSRNVASEPLNLQLLELEKAAIQRDAMLEDWYKPRPFPQNAYDKLAGLEMPVLVMNGDDDLLIPTSRSWEFLKRIKNAKLIIYPRAGHGFIWQYAEQIGREINEFLDGEGLEGTTETAARL
jgi:pimeloyl-ACP methyl ester carboxylesterase